jgi:nucleosome binding factor SPN SPT16 subunit
VCGVKSQDITYTMGSVNLMWKGVMELVQSFVEDGTFWAEEDLDGEAKPPGWLFLDAEGGGDDDDDDEEESDEYEAPEEESDESDDEDEESDESFDEEDDASEFDESEEEEAEGQDWEELEKEAKASDRQRDAFDASEDRSAPPAKKSKKR